MFVGSYTFVFGVYSAYLYTKTRSLIFMVVLHSYCNFMQVPQFGRLFVEDEETRSRSVKLMC